MSSPVIFNPNDPTLSLNAAILSPSTSGTSPTSSPTDASAVTPVVGGETADQILQDVVKQQQLQAEILQQQQLQQSVSSDDLKSSHRGLRNLSGGGKI